MCENLGNNFIRKVGTSWPRGLGRIHPHATCMHSDLRDASVVAMHIGGKYVHTYIRKTTKKQVSDNINRAGEMIPEVEGTRPWGPSRKRSPSVSKGQKPPIPTTIAVAEKQSKRSKKGPFSLYIGSPPPPGSHPGDGINEGRRRRRSLPVPPPPPVSLAMNINY